MKSDEAMVRSGILDVNVHRLEYISDIFKNEITTLYSNTEQVEKTVLNSDLVIGA